VPSIMAESSRAPKAIPIPIAVAAFIAPVHRPRAANLQHPRAQSAESRTGWPAGCGLGIVRVGGHAREGACARGVVPRVGAEGPDRGSGEPRTPNPIFIKILSNF
jgi:hypothetical protein